MSEHNWLTPDWPAPDQVNAAITLRRGGSSHPPYQGFNLATHVGDDPSAVSANRDQLKKTLGYKTAFWLRQVHGTETFYAGEFQPETNPPEADACWTDCAGLACAIMTADCLPVLGCNESGTKVVAMHAGWRGLASGVLPKALVAAGMDPRDTLLWLGPAIGPSAYQVGQDVFDAFSHSEYFDAVDVAAAFAPDGPDHFKCDLYLLARLQLQELGYSAIYGGDQCTYTQEEDYFSYRRDGQTGRMASLIWIAK